MKICRIARIPGDAIGKEVIPAGQQILEALATSENTFAFEFENFHGAGDYYREHGVMMQADGLKALLQKDAILFGSAGDPHIPDHVTLWGLRLKICQGLVQYANVRPNRILPGIDTPLKRCTAVDLNWVIVREDTEGEYSGVGGRMLQGHPTEVATDLSLMTRGGVQRIHRYAFRLAQSRPRKLLTVITKSNAQRHAMVMWDEIAVEITKERTFATPRCRSRMELSSSARHLVAETCVGAMTRRVEMGNSGRPSSVGRFLIINVGGLSSIASRSGATSHARSCPDPYPHPYPHIPVSEGY